MCSRCGKKMTLLAFITDGLAIRSILDHLGLSPPEKLLPFPSRRCVRCPWMSKGES